MRPSLCVICQHPIAPNQRTVRFWDRELLKSAVAHAECVKKGKA